MSPTPGLSTPHTPYTLQSRFARALTQRGFTQVPHKSRRYLVFTSDAPGVFFFLGAAGSWRVGRTLSTSTPVSERLRELTLTEAPLPPPASRTPSLAQL